LKPDALSGPGGIARATSEACWAEVHPFDRSLDMHVSRLRRKLSENGARDEQ